MVAQMRPRREALHHELERLRKENEVLQRNFKRLLEGTPTGRRARELYAAGYSNAWIAEIFGIPLSRARELTHPGAAGTGADRQVIFEHP